MVTPVPISNTVVKHTASMILGWRRPGKADTARFKLNLEEIRGSFFAKFLIITKVF